MRPPLTQHALKAILRYDPLTGNFEWLPRPRVKGGKRAGNTSSAGYIRIGMGGKPCAFYQAHRLAWLYMTGEWPEGDIDHINGVRHDNRWENLRNVSRSINLQNQRAARSNNRSGLLGVRRSPFWQIPGEHQGGRAEPASRHVCYGRGCARGVSVCEAPAASGVHDMRAPEFCAEISANHLGSLPRALEIVDAAADAGATLLKCPTWSPGRMCIDKSYTLEHGTWAGRKLADLYEEAFLPWDWHHFIFDRARERGMIPFSAAFDRESVDFLETLGVDRHKVASFELTDLPLIRYMASKGKPMILSTGMATVGEIADAAGNCEVGQHLTLLRCVSAYPAVSEACNLDVVAGWRRLGLGAGLSDHTLGHEAAVIATALGATMIEKHLTLSRSDGGPDAGFSAEPHEFKAMVEACKRAAACVGEVKYGPQPGEDTTLRRSLWIFKDIAQGELLCLNDNIATARPALGIAPATDLIGKRATHPLKARTPLQEGDFA